jgi:hypothetical protein
VKLRHRLAALGVLLFVALGLGTAGAQASVSHGGAPTNGPTNGCVVSQTLKIAICIPRF